MHKDTRSFRDARAAPTCASTMRARTGSSPMTRIRRLNPRLLAEKRFFGRKQMFEKGEQRLPLINISSANRIGRVTRATCRPTTPVANTSASLVQLVNIGGSDAKPSRCSTVQPTPAFAIVHTPRITLLVWQDDCLSFGDHATLHRLKEASRQSGTIMGALYRYRQRSRSTGELFNGDTTCRISIIGYVTLFEGSAPRGDHQVDSSSISDNFFPTASSPTNNVIHLRLNISRPLISRVCDRLLTRYRSRISGNRLERSGTLVATNSGSCLRLKIR